MSDGRALTVCGLPGSARLRIEPPFPYQIARWRSAYIRMNLCTRLHLVVLWYELTSADTARFAGIEWHAHLTLSLVGYLQRILPCSMVLNLSAQITFTRVLRQDRLNFPSNWPVQGQGLDSKRESPSPGREP